MVRLLSPADVEAKMARVEPVLPSSGPTPRSSHLAQDPIQCPVALAGMKSRVAAFLLLAIALPLYSSCADVGDGQSHILRRGEESLDDRTVKDPTLLPATSPRSFSMGDLSTLLHSNVAIEPIEGVRDEIVVDEPEDNDQSGRSPQHAPRIRYQATEDIDTRTYSTPQLDPLEETSTDEFPSHARMSPAEHGIQDAVDVSPLDYLAFKRPMYAQQQSIYRPPRVARSPCSCKRPPRAQPPRLRPAYRLHIRANGRGLESFLHSLISAITSFKADHETPRFSEADEAPPMSQEEGELEEEAVAPSPTRPYRTQPAPQTATEMMAPPRTNRPRPVSNTFKDLGTGNEQVETYVATQTDNEADHEIQPTSVTPTTFRQRGPDEFAFSPPPPSAPVPARSKLVDDGDYPREGNPTKEFLERRN